MSIFSDLVEEVMEIFLDDFSVYGSSFEDCFKNLETILQRCQDKNLALNWEKCHFMVTEGIVLGHKIYATALEVDQAKVVVLKTLMSSTTMKGIRSFLGHIGFYRRFIKDFSKISRPLCGLLEKDAKFDFDESCISSFEEIKSRLVSSPLMLTPDWNKSLKLCVMLVIMQWELYWDRELKRYSRPYTMPAKHLIRHKRTTSPQRRRC